MSTHAEHPPLVVQRWTTTSIVSSLAIAGVVAALALVPEALSANAVANLVKNLQKTGYFKTVELDESVQDSQNKEMQAFIFKLTCEKPVEKAPEVQPAAVKKS